MLELAGPLAVAALVLAAGGWFKLRHPAPTRAMFAVLGSRRGATGLAILTGVVELAVGLTTFLLGGRVLAWVTSLAFLVFAMVAWRLLRAPAATSCGCFGRLSSEPTRLHVGVNLAVALAALGAGVVDAPGIISARGDLPGGALAFGTLALLGAWFVVASLTVLPDAVTASRRGARAPAVQTFEITGAS